MYVKDPAGTVTQVCGHLNFLIPNFSHFIPAESEKTLHSLAFIHNVTSACHKTRI